MGLSENSVPLHPMVNISVSLLNGYNWGYAPFSDIPIFDYCETPDDERRLPVMSHSEYSESPLPTHPSARFITSSHWKCKGHPWWMHFVHCILQMSFFQVDFEKCGSRSA